jgi:transposase
VRSNQSQIMWETQSHLIWHLTTHADISFGVIHDRAKRPRTARRSEVVNNSAAGENIAGGRPAPARSRSKPCHPKRINWRLPGEPEALAKTSNRTKPQEGHYISSMDGRAKGRQHQKRQIRAMSNPSDQESGGWLENRGFGALDWASQKHSVVVVGPHGKVLEDFEIDHSALGWKKFRERMKPYGSIPFAIETSQGAAVEQLLEAGMQVYPLNPKSAQAYRERKAPSGVKDDQLDAWSFADALRVDGQNWKPLRPEGSLIKELRLLCRDEVGLIEQRTAFINQLRHALAEYYPTALEAFGDWGAVSAWMFLQRFPTPQLLEKAGKRQLEKFLHTRHLWRNESGPRRMELFAKATEFCGSEPTADAKSMLALSLVKMLFVLESQLSEYRKRIEELFESHPDHDLFGSLPGAGPKLAPRLLGEIGDDRERFDGDAQNLQCLAGTAPVTKRSGKHRECHQRWACNKHLRHAVHLFSEHTITRCAWAEIYYKAHRAKDHSHARALRCLGQRWLKIINKMWMDRTPYNAELHHLNQVKHGSWVFQLKTVNCK